jgi:hypothetical protein
MPIGKKWLELVSFSELKMVFISNFIFLVPTLLTKLKRSQDGLDSTQPAFDQLTKSCLQRNLPVEAWRSAEILAMKERGEHLGIFDINHEKAPTLAQITLQLTEVKDHSSNNMNIVDWISNGIKAENYQWVLNFISYLIFC